MWAAGKGFVAIYNWEEKKAAGEPQAGGTTAADDAAKDGRR